MMIIVINSSTQPTESIASEIISSSWNEEKKHNIRNCYSALFLKLLYPKRRTAKLNGTY